MVLCTNYAFRMIEKKNPLSRKQHESNLLKRKYCELSCKISHDEHVLALLITNKVKIIVV